MSRTCLARGLRVGVLLLGLLSAQAAAAGEPAAPDLVLPEDVEAVGPDASPRCVTLRQVPLPPHEERAVEAPLEGLPAEGGVDPRQARLEAGPREVVPLGPGTAQLEEERAAVDGPGEGVEAELPPALHAKGVPEPCLT